MPTISMFYGVIICLHFFDDERHKLPHIQIKRTNWGLTPINSN